jgi:multisubunit Na+/H+ antiporter MnhG subunit
MRNICDCCITSGGMSQATGILSHHQLIGILLSLIACIGIWKMTDKPLCSHAYFIAIFLYTHEVKHISPSSLLSVDIPSLYIIFFKLNTLSNDIHLYMYVLFFSSGTNSSDRKLLMGLR